MAKASIDRMTPREYTDAAPRKQMGYEGQKAAIRFIDNTDGTDMQRMKHIEDLESEFFLPGKLDDKDLIKWSNDRKKDLIWVGIAGNKEVSNNEKGELQGWILFQPDDTKRVRELQSKGVLGPVEKGQRVVEIAYAKYPPSEGQGQVSSAVREACMEFSRRDAVRFQAMEQEERAKFDEDLAAKSEGGMSMAEQVAARKKFEDEMMKKFNRPRTMITAYVEPRNEASVHLLEACGFVKRAMVDYEGFAPEQVPHDAYVLDWDLLHQKMQKEADKSILAKLAALSKQ